MSEEETQQLTFNFIEDGRIVEDQKRSDALKDILMPKQKEPKLPSDYKIDIVQKLESLVAEQIDQEGLLIKYVVLQVFTDPPSEPLDKMGSIRVRYELRDEEGKLKNPSIQRQNIHRIKLNSPKPMIQGLRQAFLSMRVGEVSWFKIMGHLNFIEPEPEQGDLNSIMYYKIELLECIKPAIMINNKDIDDRIANLQNIRASGMELFKNKQFDRAFKVYQKGVNYLSLWPKNIKMNQESNKLKLIFISNQGQCLMEKQDFRGALALLQSIKNSTRSTSIECKTLWRIAKSQFEDQQYEMAIYQLKEMERLMDLDGEQKSLIDQLKKKCQSSINKEYDSQLRKMRKQK